MTIFDAESGIPSESVPCLTPQTWISLILNHHKANSASSASEFTFVCLQNDLSLSCIDTLSFYVYKNSIIVAPAARSMNIVCTYHNSVLVHQRNGLIGLYISA